MRAVLIRFLDNGTQTLGKLYLFNGYDLEFSCYTLELAWKNNEPNKSCIPPGRYKLQQTMSPKFGECLSITGVPDRSFIRVHYGNYNTDTTGCVLVGDKLADINADGQQDVTSSRTTLKRLLVALDAPVTLDIVDVAGR